MFFVSKDKIFDVYFPTDHSKGVSLVLFFYICASVVLRMVCVFYYYLFLMFHSFGTSESLCFVIVALSGYFYLYLGMFAARLG